MFTKFNNFTIKAFCILTAALSTSAFAQDGPAGGMEYLKEQGGSQVSAAAYFFLILAFGAGVIFIVLGSMGIPKMSKQQATDEEKKGVFTKLGAGALLLITPIVIAFLTGIFGGTADSAASATQGLDWGIDN